MTDPKAFLLKLHKNLHILKEREAKWASNAPLELLNQIDDHEQAIGLTEQAIADEITEKEWREALAPLLVAISERTNEMTSVNISDVAGDIINSVIAGRDDNIKETHHHQTTFAQQRQHVDTQYNVAGDIQDPIFAGRDIYIDGKREPFLPDSDLVQTHRRALANKFEYRRWADESADESYIHQESKILPLMVSPYEDHSSQHREDLLQSIRDHERLLA